MIDAAQHWFSPSAPLVDRVCSALVRERDRQARNGSDQISDNDWLARVVESKNQLRSFLMEGIESFVMMLASDARAHGKKSTPLAIDGHPSEEVASHVFEHVPVLKADRDEFLTLLCSDLFKSAREPVDIGVGQIKQDGDDLVIALTEMPKVPQRLARVKGEVLEEY